MEIWLSVQSGELLDSALSSPLEQGASVSRLVTRSQPSWVSPSVRARSQLNGDSARLFTRLLSFLHVSVCFLEPMGSSTKRRRKLPLPSSLVYPSRVISCGGKPKLSAVEDAALFYVGTVCVPSDNSGLADGFRRQSGRFATVSNAQADLSRQRWHVYLPTCLF
jgi:hypothetical protein